LSDKEHTVNLIPNAIELLIQTGFLRDWPAAARLLEELSVKPSAHWRIPETLDKALGLDRRAVLPATAALIAAHTSIVIVDDLLDGDGRFEAKGWRPGDLANLAQALTAAGQAAIGGKDSALALFNQMLLQTAHGQYLDTALSVENEADYWRVARAKSSPFFEAAFGLGALLGGAESGGVQALRHTGRLYGEMIQIHDDLKDALAIPATPDWQPGRASLPVLFACTVAHPWREKFQRLRQDLANPGALREAQAILLRCGAVSYCLQQLLEREALARQVLERLNLTDRAPVDELLGRVTRPVKAIFDHLAIAPPA